MSTIDHTPKALSVVDFCERYGVSHSTFWKYVKLGAIHTIRIGGRVVVPPREVERIDAEGVDVAPRGAERAVA